MGRALSSGKPDDYFASGYVPFNLGKPHRGYIGRVARMVLAWSPASRRVNTRLAAVRKFSYIVLSKYRGVLDGLVAAGKLAATEAHQLGNCRPSGFHVLPRKRYCNMPNLCPSCGSRRAVESWLRVDAALFPPDREGKRARAAACDLVLATRGIGPEEVGDYEERLKGVLDERLARRGDCGPQLLGSRDLERRRLRRGFIWMIEGLVVDVAYRGSGVRGWKVKVRQLFAVPAGAAFDVPGASVRRIPTPTPTRREAANAVVELCRYPRGLLVTGDGRPTPARVVEKYLKTTFRRRLWAACGALRAADSEKGE